MLLMFARCGTFEAPPLALAGANLEFQLINMLHRIKVAACRSRARGINLVCKVNHKMILLRHAQSWPDENLLAVLCRIYQNCGSYKGSL